MTSSLTGSRGNTGYANQSGTGAPPMAKRPHGYQTGMLQNYTPNQMRLHENLSSFAGPDSDLSRLARGDQSFFEQLEAPAQRGFSEQLGGLASRFTGFGGQGSLSSRNSSGFQNSATAAASNFQQDLQAQRLGLQRNAVMDLKSLIQELLGERPYEQYFLPKKRDNTSAEAWGKVGGFIPGAISSLRGGGSFGDAAKGALSIFGG